MAFPLLSRADAAFGNAIEAAVSAKHRRRLRRLGWERAMEPPDDGLWAAGDPPPREGCSLEVLVDGAEDYGSSSAARASRGARLRSAGSSPGSASASRSERSWPAKRSRG